VALVAFAITGCDLCTFVPCDAWVEATFRNECGYDVEVDYIANGEASSYPKTIPDGKVDDVGTTSTEMDVVVRVKGENDWPITITWDEIQEQAPDQGDVFELSGRYCPN
jgi:hypothetical protein